MKCNSLSFFLAFTLILVSMGADCAQRTEVKKDIAFIVRKADRVKNIALRFHIAPATLTRLNIPLHKRQMVYAGKKLVIPVWLRLKNVNQAPSEYNQSDYELDTDSLDAYIREDFLCVADIEADTVRRITIGKEIRKIDKNIWSLRRDLDSIELESMKGHSNKELRQIEMARERHTGNFALASQIDTLKMQKQKLADERAKIDLRAADYEYLLENASYEASHHARNEGKPIQLEDWADDPNKISEPVSKSKKVGQL